MIMRRCARATIQAFITHIAAAVMYPAGSSGAGHHGILPQARPEPETP
jgi:hypothetical protein